MATTTTPTKAVSTRAKAETDKAEALALETLKDQFTVAHKAFDEADAKAKTFLHQRAVAAVEMARIAFRTASHPAIATTRYPYNITGAAKALDIAVGTLRPYALAGQALGKKDRAGLLSAPNAEDIAIVEGSFDATSRADQKAKRVREAEKKAALEKKAAELDRLKAAQAPASGEEAPAATEGTEAPEAPATGQQAPVEAPATEAPEAPAGPSLQDDTLRLAKELVGKLKGLQASGDKATILKVNAILADFYPALKA